MSSVAAQHANSVITVNMTFAQCFLHISQEQLIVNACNSKTDKELVEGVEWQWNILSLLNNLAISADVPLLKLINRSTIYVEFNSMRYPVTNDGIADTIGLTTQDVNRRLSRIGTFLHNIR